MIKLTNFSKDDVRTQLKVNGMRESLIKSVMHKIGKKSVSFGDDGVYKRKFSIVKVGKSYGVAKRCTYRTGFDEPKLATGFTLALMRALNMLKDKYEQN